MSTQEELDREKAALDSFDDGLREKWRQEDRDRIIRHHTLETPDYLIAGLLVVGPLAIIIALFTFVPIIGLSVLGCAGLIYGTGRLAVWLSFKWQMWKWERENKR